MTRHKQQYTVFFGYDGRRFHGVAPQPGVHTATAALWQRLAQATGQIPYAVSLAARTDAGVSARQNLLSFRLREPACPKAVTEALQRTAADGLSDVAARAVPERVMARNMVLQKHYCYRLAGRRAPADADPDTRADADPDAGDVGLWRLACAFSPARLERALRLFCGTRNFSRFCYGPSGAHPVRTIHRIGIADEDAPRCLAIHIYGDGFLRRMIRMLVGTAAEAACGLRSVGSIATLLDADAPAAPGARPSAPARGLTLEALTLTPKAHKLLSRHG